MRNPARWLFCLAALILCAGTARADTAGTLGAVASLQVLTVSADTFLQYNGRVVVKNTDGDLDEYRWGGTSCGNRLLTEAQIAELHSVLGNKKILIAPVYQDGQGQTRCMVGFTLVPKPNLKFITP